MERSFERPCVDGDDNIEIHLTEDRCDSVDRILQDKFQWQIIVNTLMNLRKQTAWET
jgi:hypothetical protein